MSKATFDPTRYNRSNNKPFSDIMEAQVSRRALIKSTTGMAVLGLFAGTGLAGCSSDSSSDDGTTLAQSDAVLGFDSIDGSLTDAVAVAAGYTAQVLIPWGTPLNSMASPWQSDGTNTPEDQANATGMNHDGMHFFALNDEGTDGLLCVNHEYINQRFLHPDGATFDETTELRTVADEIRKEINAHGVSVVRIQNNGGTWEVVLDDPRNRRYTGASEMSVSGPVGDNPILLQTPYSPDGQVVRGTLNNCGNGYTPWGTYLTCEENWPGYFTNNDEEADRPEDQNRIGLSNGGSRYSWEDLAGDATEVDDEFTRFNVTPSGANALDDYRNEANGHGYIVEIDPFTANSTAVKRTALGRFRHEGCIFGKLEEGQPITFYSGHDARFEYIYKFVSDAVWDPADAESTNRLATGAKYMNAGTLYVAIFSENGVGTWAPLTLSATTTEGGTLGDTFSSMSELILNTAGAADLMGATPMDRPEWGAVDPITGSVYFTLTNNTRRTEANVANPRIDNSFGHIIRFDEGETVDAFTWDIFVFGAPPVDDADINRSGLTGMNTFASPDGLVFDSRGIMWVQTDNGADEVEELTNDQMLAVIPSQLQTDGSQDVLSAANQSEMRRFFVGPNGCEVTGLTFNPDETSFFANIQHPGNWPFSDDATEVTPEGTEVRARSATVVFQKVDGGQVGA